MTDQTMRKMKQVNNEEQKKLIINTYKFGAYGFKLFINRKYLLFILFDKLFILKLIKICFNYLHVILLINFI